MKLPAWQDQLSLEVDASIASKGNSNEPLLQHILLICQKHVLAQSQQIALKNVEPELFI